MAFSVISYSFHRQLESHQGDIFKYITDSKALGCTHLDIWNDHLVPLVKETHEFRAGRNALRPHFSPEGVKYAEEVRRAIDESGLGVVCLSVDDAHIWEDSPVSRDFNRKTAHRWLDIAEILGAQYARIDAGGTPDLPDTQFETIVKGYNDLIPHAQTKNIGILMENHFGATRTPANVVKIIEAVPGLGLLFDSRNWESGMEQAGWNTCARYAKHVHIKTRALDENGNDPTSDVSRVVRLLVETGYNGVWGIESVAQDGDEYTNAQQSLELVKKSLAALKA